MQKAEARLCSWIKKGRVIRRSFGRQLDHREEGAQPIRLGSIQPDPWKECALPEAGRLQSEQSEGAHAAQSEAHPTEKQWDLERSPMSGLEHDVAVLQPRRRSRSASDLPLQPVQPWSNQGQQLDKGCGLGSHPGQVRASQRHHLLQIHRKLLTVTSKDFSGSIEGSLPRAMFLDEKPSELSPPQPLQLVKKEPGTKLVLAS